jgi:hypothetical protein
MTRKENPPADYEIGRGKPPKKSQFVKGKSGNPGGRRKGSVNLTTIIKSISESEIRVTEGGRTRNVSAMEAMLLKLLQMGLAGDRKAIAMSIAYWEKYVKLHAEPETNLSEDDELVLARMLTRFQAALPNEDLREAHADEPDDE